jgi:catechol 2,3-dioxygenase-like lactoylglutathione lyase family enzyme
LKLINLHINRLQHIGIPVTDLDRSATFYKRLGFTDVMHAGFDYNGGKGKVKMMQLKDITLELYQMPEPELAQIRTRQNGRIDHIAFDVDDIEQTYAVLKNGGFFIVEPQPVFMPFWKKGCRYFIMLGPDGERLEFNQVL